MIYIRNFNEHVVPVCGVNLHHNVRRRVGCAWYGASLRNILPCGIGAAAAKKRTQTPAIRFTVFSYISGMQFCINLPLTTKKCSDFTNFFNSSWYSMLISEPFVFLRYFYSLQRYWKFSFSNFCNSATPYSSVSIF